jgi:hypothetical protein
LAVQFDGKRIIVPSGRDLLGRGGRRWRFVLIVGLLRDRCSSNEQRCGDPSLHSSRIICKNREHCTPPTTRPESSASSAMGCVGYNFRARIALAALVGHAIVTHLSGAILLVRSNLYQEQS